MSSRESILKALAQNQPKSSPLPVLDFPVTDILNPVDRFKEILSAIGGAAHSVNGYEEIAEVIKASYNTDSRIVNLVPELKMGESLECCGDPHSLDDVELAIIRGRLGVAENAAIWITDDMLPQRVLPFITQNLAVVIAKESIVPMMLQAYDIIGNAEYGFGAFIAGPSKTADIEQSLVLGAHGSKSMRVFII